MTTYSARNAKGTETVLILAAGEGSRLRPVTEEIPKALVQVGDRSLVEWQLEALEEAGYPAEAVHIVGGHRAAAFLDHEVIPSARLMIFEDYETINNIGTLAYALSRLEPPVLVVNSDTLFSRTHLEMFEGDERESELLYDPTTPPRQEAMKVDHEDGRLSRIAKTIDPATADGEYIGLVRIGTEAHASLVAACRRIAGSNPGAWYENAIDEICVELAFRCRSIGDSPWIEIDDHDDLASAEAVVRELASLP